MTGKTHRAGGMLVSILGFAYLRQHGLLLGNVNEGLQWLIMYPFCMWGSVASDLDHSWESCPMHDYPSKIVNKVLHAPKAVKDLMDATPIPSARRSFFYKVCDCLNASHRSWQTHSDLTLFVFMFLLMCTMEGHISSFQAVDMAIARLILTGLCLGIFAHLLLDCLTPDGIWLMGLVWLNWLLNWLGFKDVKLPRKLHFVPRGLHFFDTGGVWEQWVYKVLNIVTYIALVWLLFVTLLPSISIHLPFEISFF